jgi:hypothetical protein
MDPLALIGSTMGLGFLAGIRLYATVFALGLAIRLGWYHPGAGAAGLLVLAHPAVLTASGLACLVEFVADKVPWVDSAWDSVHTFIRPIGAVLLASAAIGNLDPALKTILMLLSGSVALASTGSKASTRLAVNHSPEPFSNIALSLAEDAAVPAGMWVTLKHPEVAAALVSIFLAVVLWLAPKIYRSVRLRWIALRLWHGGGRGTVISRPGGSASPALSASRPAALRVIDAHAAPIPSTYARSVQKSLAITGPPSGIRAAATSSIDGMANSVGYLAVGPNGLAFVTQRWFRKCAYVLPFADIESIDWKHGLLMNKLVLRTAQGKRTFHIFKDVKLKELPSAAPTAQAAVSSV